MLSKTRNHLRSSQSGACSLFSRNCVLHMLMRLSSLRRLLWCFRMRRYTVLLLFEIDFDMKTEQTNRLRLTTTKLPDRTSEYKQTVLIFIAISSSHVSKQCRWAWTITLCYPVSFLLCVSFRGGQSIVEEFYVVHLAFRSYYRWRCS